MAMKMVTAMIWIPHTDQERYQQIKSSIEQWRQDWKGHIRRSFLTIEPRSAINFNENSKHRRTIAFVITDKESLQNLPSFVTSRIYNFKPVWGLAANVRDITYSMKGLQVRGSKHFEAGVEIYPHNVFSGDGYERTFVTGFHRETKQFTSVIMPTIRLENWRAVFIKNPVVIYRMQYVSGGWSGQKNDRQLAATLAYMMNNRVEKDKNKIC